jgi:magnesium chelatase family protein
MVSHINTIAFHGVDVIDVEVQTQISQGLPTFQIVGLPNKAVAESRDRVRAAFQSIGLAFPAKRVLINLAPADITKEGSHYDLAIALGILVELQILSQEEVSGYVVMGELSLNANLSRVHGALPAAIHANSKDKGLICPSANGKEVTWSGNRELLAPNHLLELINHLKGTQMMSQPAVEEVNYTHKIEYDLKDIKGQEGPKRALEIAAAGGHNMLMIGPPGAGKSMLAKRLAGIIPPLDSKEMLEVSVIASIAGNLAEKGIIKTRPFRDPHSSSSMPAMVGGGKNAKPGEVTLAHLGVLFLDELPEFSRNVLEALRQPIETGSISIARVNNHVTYPSRFQLVAAMNPCRCGHFGYLNTACSKQPKCAEEYQGRISGPLLDRFDIRIDVPSSNAFELQNAPEGESSEQVAKRVLQARQIQAERYKPYGIKINAEADGTVLSKYTALDEGSKQVLQKATEKFNLSMRGLNRVLRVARTIADLDGIANLSEAHLTEALSYRMTRFLF